MEEILELLIAGGRWRFLGGAALLIVGFPLLKPLVKAAVRSGVYVADHFNELMAEVRAEEFEIARNAIESLKNSSEQEAASVVPVLQVVHADENACASVAPVLQLVHADESVRDTINVHGMTITEFENRIEHLEFSDLFSLKDIVYHDERKGIKEAWEKAVARVQPNETT